MKYIQLMSLILCVLSIPTVLYAQLIGGNYEIYADTFSFVNGNGSTGGVYDLYDTGGEFFAASTGGGDYVLRGGYRAVEKGILRVDVSESNFDYGELSPGTVVTSSVDVSVWTDSSTGYSLLMRENQDPTTVLSATIDDVNIGESVDGTVEAYGITATGDDVIISGDLPITTAAQVIAQTSGIVTNRTTQIIYKVAVDNSTDDGIYRHVVYPTVLVNP